MVVTLKNSKNCKTHTRSSLIKRNVISMTNMVRKALRKVVVMVAAWTTFLDKCSVWAVVVVNKKAPKK